MSFGLMRDPEVGERTIFSCVPLRTVVFHLIGWEEEKRFVRDASNKAVEVTLAGDGVWEYTEEFRLITDSMTEVGIVAVNEPVLRPAVRGPWRKQESKR